MSHWNEIRNTHIETEFDEEIDGMIYKSISIDAWCSGSDNEEGTVIANVILTMHGDICVIYTDSIARTDDYAQEIIQETISTIKDKNSIWIDDEKNDDGTYDVMVYDENTEEYDDELCVGHIKTLVEAETIIENIINDNPHILFTRLQNQKK